VGVATWTPAARPSSNHSPSRSSNSPSDHPPGCGGEAVAWRLSQLKLKRDLRSRL
jgi:hypothetical protein